VESSPLNYNESISGAYVSGFAFILPGIIAAVLKVNVLFLTSIMIPHLEISARRSVTKGTIQRKNDPVDEKIYLENIYASYPVVSQTSD